MSYQHFVLFLICISLSLQTQAQSASQTESSDAREEALFGGDETETRTKLEDDLFGETTDSDVSNEGDLNGLGGVSTESGETFRDSGDRIGELIA